MPGRRGSPHLYLRSHGDAGVGRHASVALARGLDELHRTGLYGGSCAADVALELLQRAVRQETPMLEAVQNYQARKRRNRRKRRK